MKKLYLVDISSFIFRAYYAVRPLSTSKGLPTNAIYGFVTMILQLLKEEKAENLVFCFDSKGPTFRKVLDPEYKANRGPMPDELALQIPYFTKITEYLGIPFVQKDGFEADDLIGTYVKWGEALQFENIIVSGDKDFAQLISETTTMYDTMKRKRYDPEGVIEKWGVPSSQFRDYLAIIGDSSDNIKGVKGIGPKGAQKLLAEFKTLESIYENLDKIKSKTTVTKLEDCKDQVFLAQKLVTIKPDVEFEGLDEKFIQLKTPHYEKLTELFKELEFESLLSRLPKGGTAAIGKSEAAKNQSIDTKQVSATANQTPQKPVQYDLKKLKNLDEFKELLSKGFQKTDQTSQEVFVFKNNNQWVYEFQNSFISIEGIEPQSLVDWNENIHWVGFDIKNTFSSVDVENFNFIFPKNFDDIMLMAYMLKPSSIKFDGLLKTYLGTSWDPIDSIEKKLTDLKKLYVLLRERMHENDLKIYNEIEKPLVPILFQMERRGIGLNTKELETYSSELEEELKNLEAVIFDLAGESFNILSPKQLGHILFEKLGLVGTKKTKTGYSTNSDVLEKLKPLHPIAEPLLLYREYSKLKSTYVDALPKLLNAKTNRIHTSFNQALTATGRLSSQNPNLQNIPIRTEKGKRVRRAFEAKEGSLLLCIDYSQIELRILAHITGDKGLVEAFKNDLDIHAATASSVFGVKLENVTPEQRRMAKAVNFGLAYGQGVYGLSETLGIPRPEAKEIIDNYFRQFPLIQNYMSETIEVAKEKGYVETFLGRRRHLPELNASNGMVRKFGERAAINAPIQGAASDLVKKAMIDVEDNFPEVRLLLQVHDELIFEVKEENIDTLVGPLKQLMEKVLVLKVPLKVNATVSKCWSGE